MARSGIEVFKTFRDNSRISPVTRVGKEKKFGVRKGSTPPGNRSNRLKVR